MRSKFSILQWNIKLERLDMKNDREIIETRLSVLSALLEEYEPSLFAFQESSEVVDSILLSKGYEIHHSVDLTSAFKRKEWVRYGAETFPVVGRDCLGLNLLHNRSRAHFWFWNVHLLSRSRSQDIDIRERARDLKEDISKTRRGVEWVRSVEIIAGDFNLFPYDEAIQFGNGLYGSRHLGYALAKKKKYIPHDHHVPLYNPTWSLFSLSNPPLGTYYKNGPADGPWYLYDQILLSPEIAVEEQHSGFQMIVQARDWDLRSPRARAPNGNIGSDHFPTLAYASPYPKSLFDGKMPKRVASKAVGRFAVYTLGSSRFTL